MLTAFVEIIYFLSVLLRSVSCLNNVKWMRAFSRRTCTTWSLTNNDVQRDACWIVIYLHCWTPSALRHRPLIGSKTRPTLMSIISIFVQSRRCVKIAATFLWTTNYLLFIHSYQDVKPKHRTPSLCFILYHFSRKHVEAKNWWEIKQSVETGGWARKLQFTSMPSVPSIFQTSHLGSKLLSPLHFFLFIVTYSDCTSL